MAWCLQKFLQLILGFTLPQKLTFNTHVDITCKKANSTRAFLQRNFIHCSHKIKEATYKNYVRPIAEYASIAWDPNQCWSESGLGLGLNGWVRVRVRTRVRTRTLVLWTRTRTRTPPLWTRTQALWTRTLVLWTRTRTRTPSRWTRTHSESRWVRWEM